MNPKCKDDPRGARARLRRGAAILAGASVLAFTGMPLIAAPAASARFLDVGPHGGFVLRPLPAQFACAMERALADRQVSCR